MKKCKECNDKLIINDNWTISLKKQYRYICKKCNANYYKTKYNPKYAKKYYQNNIEKIKKYVHKKSLDYNKLYNEKIKDGFCYVYLLPKENYVGQTNCLQNRMYKHKSDGRNTKYKILHKTSCREEAKLVESAYHSLGYKGFAYGN